jgi:hypothetical protein
MDPEELSRLQDSNSRIRCDGITGHIAGFRVSGAGGTLRLRDEDGVEHEVGGTYEVVDPVDEAKVEQVRAARMAEDAAFLEGTAVGALRAAALEG